MKAQHSSKSVLHYTPRSIVNLARDALGGLIALDPASDAFGNRVVQAVDFYAQDGLVKPWYGPLFLNPPGKSESNPGGAAAWWSKLIREWRAADEEFDAVFVGFSLEILQSCQSHCAEHPLKFPTCIPAKRIQFDVPIETAREKAVEGTHSSVGIAAAAARRLRTLDELVALGADRAPGTAPTHGNFITMVTSSAGAAARFRLAFSQIGVVT